MSTCSICENKFYDPDVLSNCKKAAHNCKLCTKKSLADEELCAVHVKKRTPVECPACENIVCKYCFIRYFLDLKEEPKCMHCNISFDIEFLYDEFGGNFLWGPLKKHREEVLLEHVISKLKDYQNDAKLIKLRHYNEIINSN